MGGNLSSRDMSIALFVYVAYTHKYWWSQYPQSNFDHSNSAAHSQERMLLFLLVVSPALFIKGENITNVKYRQYRTPCIKDVLVLQRWILLPCARMRSRVVFGLVGLCNYCMCAYGRANSSKFVHVIIRSLLSAQLTPLRWYLLQQTIATCKCKRQACRNVFPEGDCMRLKSRDRSSL